MDARRRLTGPSFDTPGRPERNTRAALSIFRKRRCPNNLKRRETSLREILFVDLAVGRAVLLLKGVRPGIEVVYLPADGNALAAMAAAITGGAPVKALHILSHGGPGSLRLCGGNLDVAGLKASGRHAGIVRSGLAEGAEVLLYGCSVAAGKPGAAFVAELEATFGCTVRASDRPVGGVEMGGSWPEVARVPLAFGAEVRAAYPARLATQPYSDMALFRCYPRLIHYEEGVVSIRFGMPGEHADTTPNTQSSDEDVVWSSQVSRSTIQAILAHQPPDWPMEMARVRSRFTPDEADDRGRIEERGMAEDPLPSVALANDTYALPAFSVDVTPPRTLGPPDLVATSDLGLSSTDNITSSVTPEFTGSAVSGDIVSILVGGVTAGTVTAVDGSWTFVHSLTAGSYAISVHATDAAGNVGATSSALGLTIDTSAPGPAQQPDLLPTSDSGASNTDNITSRSQPSVVGIGGLPDALVHILVDGVTAGSAAVNGAGRWTYTFDEPIADGAHVITAVASDIAGNDAAPSGGLAVVVDTTAPALSAPDLASASDSGVSPSDNVTNSPTQQLTGTASDGDRISIMVSGWTVQTVTAEDGVWSSTHTFGEGVHSVSVQGKDLAGNLGAPSPALVLTVDATAPAVLAAPDLLAISDTGLSDQDNVTRSTIQRLAGAAADGDIVSILVDGVTAGTVTALDGSWSATQNLGEGTYEIAVQATDRAGNVGQVSDALTLTVDTTAPSTAPVRPDLLAESDSGASAVDDVTRIARPTLTGAGAGPDATVRILLDGTGIGTAVATGSGEWTFTVPDALPDGVHAITAVSEDAAGNQSPVSPPLSLTVDTGVVAPDRPTLATASDSGASSQDAVTAVARPTVHGSGAEAGASIDIHDDGVSVGSVTASADGTWSYTFAGALSEGLNAITVVQADLAGNVSVASAPLDITLDTTAPAALAAPDLAAGTDTGVSATDNTTASASQTFTGAASDGDRVHLIVDGATVSTVAASSGSWTVTETLAEGSHDVTVGVTDAAGNDGPLSAALRVTVDRTAPPAAGAPDLDASSDHGVSSTDNLTNTATPTFSGQGAVPGGAVQIRVGGATVGSAVADATGAWRATVSDPLPAGSHAVTVVAEDIAGNEAPASATLDIQIDLIAPAAPGVIAVPDLIASNDDGASSTDNVTSVTTPTFVGSGVTASAAHALLANGVIVGSFVSEADGTYTVTAGALAPGSYGITVRELDPAGNASADSPTLALTIAAPPGAGDGSPGGGGGGASPTPAAPSTPTTSVPATTTTTTVTTTTSTGGTVTTQTQTIQNPSTTATASAAIVQGSAAAGTGVTATLPAQTSIVAEGPSASQTPSDALSTLIAAVDARQPGSGAGVISGLRTFFGHLAPGATLDVRTLVPTTSAASLSTPIVISGSASGTGSGSSEAFVIDVRSLPTGSTVQLDNIEFASIIGSATVNGGSGNNFATGDSASQFISLGEGDDTLLGGDGDDTIGSGAGDDSLDGEGGNDGVFGGEGSDTVIGSGGADVVYGNQQADILYGNRDSDTLFGGQDADALFGGREDDILYGNFANDSLSGQVGNDTLFGGQGDDLIQGGVGDDRLVGNRHDDTLSGGTGDDRLSGGDGDDALYGGPAGGAAGIDVLDGGNGNDVLSGGQGVDWIYTGSGRDTVYVGASNGYDVIVDFDSAAGDIIVIVSNVNGSGLVGFAALRSAASDNPDGHVEVDLGNSNFIRIMGLTTAQLTSDMFQFF